MPQGGALLNIRDAFGISDWAAEAIVAAAKFGAVPGTFLGGACWLCCTPALLCCWRLAASVLLR